MTSWVADPAIGWRILLTARLPEPPDRADLAARLAAIATLQEWPAPPLRVHDDLSALQRELVAADPAPLVVGLCGAQLVLSAHHSAVDGLGLLTLLARLGAGPVHSSARGVGARTTTGGAARTTTRRLREALLHPPARVTPPPGILPGTGDALVERTLPGAYRTASLVDAASRAIVAHERACGRTSAHVAIAVGAVREQASDAATAPVADHSVLLRLTDVEQLGAAGIAAALATAPVQTPPSAGGRPLLARATSLGLRALAPRLGSTLLVSHLGEVTAPGVRDLAFHPVTAGGSGLSLGAVGHDGTTTLTLRGRASAWNDNGLEQLLEAVVSLL